MYPIYPKLSVNIVITAKDDRILYLHPDYPDWITVNQRYKKLFDIFDGKHSVTQITEFINSNYENDANLLNDQIKKLFQTSLLFEHNIQNTKLDWKPKELKPRYIYLTLTDDCNLNCAYCYAKERTRVNSLALPKWISFIDKLLALSNNIIFNFTGGEPLVVPFIFELAEYINRKGSSCILLTNGTRIHNIDIANKIANNFQTIKISLDSINDDINSVLRGKNTLQKVKRSIELLIKVKANYIVVATITKLNKDCIEEFADYFNNQVSFQPFYKMGSGKRLPYLYITGNEYYNALTKNGLFKYLHQFHNSIHDFRMKPSKRCAMATEELSIAPNGDIYPCHMLHYDELRIGNIDQVHSLENTYRNSKILSDLREMTVDSINSCKKCVVRNFCGGGCRARIDFYQKGLKGKDQFCIFEKRQILDALLYSYG